MRAMSDTSPEIWTVSQLTRRVKNLLETQISYVWVSGEISNYRVSPAGHAYFTLKDAESQIDAVMFRGKLMGLRFGPENGLEVIVYGLVTVYEKRGAYQIVCDEMQPKGMGALQLAFEKLRKKLQQEGLFEESHKKPLPLLPRRIGVVTSPTGAAIRDILNVIRRRFANVHIILWPARVQGDEAAPEIVEGIRVLDAWGVDVMIVGRGGGSLEDLWPFNEEIVVRAVYEARTPIISAVGHEIDYTLTDFAADVRAPTPSAAAELVGKGWSNGSHRCGSALRMPYPPRRSARGTGLPSRGQVMYFSGLPNSSFNAANGLTTSGCDLKTPWPITCKICDGAWNGRCDPFRCFRPKTKFDARASAWLRFGSGCSKRVEHPSRDFEPGFARWRRSSAL
jgi:hypothetical protein